MICFLQSGACGGMAQTDDAMPQFKTSKQAPEVLDPKVNFLSQNNKFGNGVKLRTNRCCVLVFTHDTVSALWTAGRKILSWAQDSRYRSR